MRTYNDYLMLDKDDITKVCGVISLKEILKEMTSSKFRSLLANGKLFREKYILIEKEFNQEKETFYEMRFDESDTHIYYATTQGEFYSISKKSGKKHILTKYIHCNRATIKANKKEYIAKNLIAKLFLKSNFRDKVEVKNGDMFDCSVENLEITPCKKHLIQLRNKEAKPVGLFEKGKLVKKWKNVNDCAEELCYSRTAIYDFIKKDRKYLIYDIRFLEG